MFISKELKKLMAATKNELRAQPRQSLESNIGAYLIVVFLFLVLPSSESRLAILLGMYFVTALLLVFILWLYFAVPKGSAHRWPPQFKTLNDFRNGFFKLENYPNIHPQSLVVKGVRWVIKKLKKN
jgi:hypothetical protein